MTKDKLKPTIAKEAMQELLREKEDFLKPLIETVIQEVLEAEMNAGLTSRQRGANWATAGLSQWLLPTQSNHAGGQDRAAGAPGSSRTRFSTEVFERYQRSEKALVTSLIEMYVQGVSTAQGEKGSRRVVRAPFQCQCDESAQPKPG